MSEENCGSKTKIKELKDAAIAYRLACEYFYCPNPLHLKRMKDEGPEVTEEILSEYGGMRPDEIAHYIMRKIGEL